MSVGIESGGEVRAVNDSLEPAQTLHPVARAPKSSPAGAETSIANPLGPSVARGNTLW